MYPSFIIFGREFYLFGIMAILGVGAGVGISFLMCRLVRDLKPVVKSYDVVLTGLIGFAGAIVGAFLLRPIMKLPEIVFNWGEFAEFSTEMLIGYVFGELVFFGGLIGGSIAAVIFCLKFKIPVMQTFDALSPAIAFGHALGRIGCLLTGCCHGILVSREHPFAIVYPPESVHAQPGIPLLATPAIEAAVLLIISLVLGVVFVKTKRNGLVIGLYFVTYSISRFVIEFFRGDAVRGVYGLLSTSQYISIGLFIVGVLIIIRSKKLQNSYG